MCEKSPFIFLPNDWKHKFAWDSILQIVGQQKGRKWILAAKSWWFQDMNLPNGSHELPPNTGSSIFLKTHQQRPTQEETNVSRERKASLCPATLAPITHPTNTGSGGLIPRLSTSLLAPPTIWPLPIKVIGWAQTKPSDPLSNHPSITSTSKVGNERQRKHVQLVREF